MNTHEQDPSCVCVQTLLFLIFVDGISSSTYNSPEEIAEISWRSVRSGKTHTNILTRPCVRRQ